MTTARKQGREVSNSLKNLRGYDTINIRKYVCKAGERIGRIRE